MESHLGFFFFFSFWERYRKDPFPGSMSDEMENKTVGILSVKIQEVLIGGEGLTEGFQGARTHGVNGIRKEVCERIQMDGFPRECG